METCLERKNCPVRWFRNPDDSILYIPVLNGTLLQQKKIGSLPFRYRQVSLYFLPINPRMFTVFFYKY
jgi:hypothetical protein